MPHEVTPTFRVRNLPVRDPHLRLADHLSDGERRALVAGHLTTLRNRRYVRWN